MANDVSVVGQGVVCFKKCVWFLTLSLPLASLFAFIFIHSVSLFACPCHSGSLKCAHM